MRKKELFTSKKDLDNIKFYQEQFDSSKGRLK